MTLNRHVVELERSKINSLGVVLARNLEKKVKYLAKQMVRVAGKDYSQLRHKRPIELIGNLISDLFGNPGPEDWKK